MIIHHMKVNGKKIDLMDTVYINLMTVLNSKANGKMDKSMALVNLIIRI